SAVRFPRPLGGPFACTAVPGSCDSQGVPLRPSPTRFARILQRRGLPFGIAAIVPARSRQEGARPRCGRTERNRREEGRRAVRALVLEAAPGLEWQRCVQVRRCPRDWPERQKERLSWGI